MKKVLLLLAALGLVALLLVGCQSPSQPATFIDDMGREVVVDEVPQRILSHVPGLTETLFALGLEDEVVGVSDYCDYPEAAKLKPSVGDYFNPSVERIVALEPDLVLTDGHSESVKQLDNLGITYAVIDPTDIASTLEGITLLGQITDREAAAAAIVADFNQRTDDVSARVQGATRLRVFYLYYFDDLNSPWTAGPGSFTDELISLAGGQNVVQAEEAWLQYSVEQILSADPEIILFDVTMGSDVASLDGFKAQLKEHPAWREVTAVKNDHIYPINGVLLNQPGPRLVQGLEVMAGLIHPELFP